MKVEEVAYNATTILTDFHLSNNFMRVIRGPVGSGKSTASCWEIWRRANEQAPAPNGKRQTAFLVARNTYKELEDTTVATWLDWFSEERVGKFLWHKMEHRIEYGDLECLVMFRSLDRPDDIKKILSLEITGAWFNEAREMPLGIVNRMAERVGRYPPAKDGGATWFGMWADTNPPDEDHWLAEFEREPPKGWEFFVQPPGLIERDGKLVTNPNAENLSNLPKGYYEINLGAMKPEEIKVYRKNEFGFVVDGKPVTPDFRPDLHVRADIKPLPDLPLRIGMDVGGGTLNPSAIFFQRNRRGAYVVLAEVVCRDMGIENFGRQIKAELADRFSDHVRQLESGDDDAIMAAGDPAGGKRDELYETVVFDHLRSACGFRVREAPSQDPKVRLDALRAPMQRHIDGLPGFMVHPRCRKLVRGLSGGWHYRRMAVSGREAFADKPDKGEYSHPCFVAGTPVLTPNGQVPIERLRAGDLVTTHVGVRKVLGTGARWSDSILRLQLSDGTAIITTPCHPFAAESGGFVRADALGYGHPVISVGEPWAGRQSIQFRSSTESDFIGSQGATIKPMRSLAACMPIGLFGSCITGLFQKVMTFITETVIGPTTRFLTWSFAAKSVTVASTDVNRPWQLPSEWPSYAPSPLRGMEQQRGVKRLDEPPLQPMHVVRVDCASAPVNDAAAPTKPTEGSAPNSVLTRVQQRLDGLLAWMTSRGTVNSAANHSRAIVTKRYGFARSVVRAEPLPHGGMVFNLNVDVDHVFYAHGVLVSNCEACGYGLLDAGEMRTLQALDNDKRAKRKQPASRPGWIV